LVISFRTVVYSIKLKLEFHALTQLRELTSTYACSVCQGISGTTCPEADDQVVQSVLGDDDEDTERDADEINKDDSVDAVCHLRP
jgi:hypothetical protein